ncbi:MAG: type IX secretion system membrane protein PorP/SprF, partial [Flavobacteriales bacterium]|nr:type IX secretion system membrane protein PorP/SprF [Flavobacteriales bacterium]
WATIATPFLTNSLGFEKQLYVGNEDLAIGLYINYDQSGDLKYNGNKIYLSGAYAKKFKKHGIRVAIQPGFVNKTYSTNNLTYPDQFNNGTGSFDPGIASGDPLSGTQLSYADLNVGGLWTFDGKKIKPEAGFSLFHLLRTKETFDNNFDVLPLRSQWNAASYFYIGERYFVYPYVQYMFQGKASSSLSGVNLGLRFKRNSLRLEHVYVGHIFRSGFNRISDALIPVVGTRIYGFDLGVSYDINMSTLKSATQGRGALEVSVIYTHKTNFLKKSTPPCDRM